MKKFTNKFFFFFIFIIISCALEKDKSQFVVELDGLKREKRLSEVYPEKIQGHFRKLSQILLPEGMYGTQADYGDEVRIQIIEVKSLELGEYFFREILTKYLARYKLTYQRKTTGSFHVEGEASEGEILLVFYDFPWILTIEAAQRQILQELQEKFPYFRFK